MELLRINKQPLFVNDFFSNFFEKEFNTMPTRENIIEKKDEFIIELLVPGILKNNLSIDVEDNLLTIKHQLDNQSKPEEVNYIKFGFKKGAFNKEFKLPENIDYANISASFENGILAVVLPKKKVVKTTKKIKIK